MIRLPQTYYIIKKYLKHYDEISMLYNQQCADNFGKQIQLWNWWEEEKTAYWLQKFIEQQGLLKGSKKTVALCSVFGERDILERVNADVKIFFSGENLHNSSHAQYADYMLSGKKTFDMGVGFDEFDDDIYMRFPLWMIYMFGPFVDEKSIRERCAQLRYPEVGRREKFACMIARADISGIRKDMYNAISVISSVDCPSDLFHNDETLVTTYKDDKVAYMQQYQYNICPENSNARDYITEKVFEAITAGCIPIYWGSYNEPEPKILNPEAIIFWNKDDEGKKAVEQIKELCANPKQMEAFMKQPRLLSGAEEEILRMMTELHNRLKALLV